MKLYITLLFLLCAPLFISAQEVITAKNEPSSAKPINDTNAGIENLNNNASRHFDKKTGRFGFLFGGSKQWIDEFETSPDFGGGYMNIGSIKVYYERFNLFGLAHEDAGVGFDLTFVDGFEKYYRGTHPTSPDIFMASKLYVSGYAFRDFDLGNIVTVGILGGPSIVTNFVSTDLESNPSDYEGTVVSFGVGIHTGQYVLKYLGGEDKKKFCLRLGFEQFISVNSGFTGLFAAGLGF